MFSLCNITKVSVLHDAMTEWRKITCNEDLFYLHFWLILLVKMGNIKTNNNMQIVRLFLIRDMTHFLRSLNQRKSPSENPAHKTRLLVKVVISRAAITKTLSFIFGHFFQRKVHTVNLSPAYSFSHDVVPPYLLIIFPRNKLHYAYLSMFMIISYVDLDHKKILTFDNPLFEHWFKK